MKMYSLFKRRKGTENYFYVQFKDDDTGRYGNAKSVEMLSKRLGDAPHHVTKRPEADSIVRRAIEAGLDGNEKRKDPLFVDFLNSFWDYETSYYVKRENRKKANSINRDHCYNMAGCVRNHVAPFLPKNLKCSQVRKRHIERIQENAVEVSKNVWHSTLKSLSVPVKELMKMGILATNPLFDLDVYSHDTVSTVGALTQRETDKLILQMYQDATFGYVTEIKRGSRKSTETVEARVYLDKRVYLATALSCATGMRRGEVLGLHVEDIRFPNSDDSAEEQAQIDVRCAFAIHQGLKSTKSGKARTVPVDRWLADELVAFAQTNPHGNGLVFYSDTVTDKPIYPMMIDKWFIRELERIGISEEERKERHIVFHSLRHYANTEMRTRIGDERTQLVMGHTSKAMTDRYDTGDNSKRVYQIGRDLGSLVSDPKTMEG